jgi:voltage-gated sodium channel
VIGVAFIPALAGSSTLLRLARLARIVRIIRLLPDIRVLLVAVIRSLPPLLSMIVLTTLILFVYGMVQWSWVYFVSFVLVAALIVRNVLLGIVLNAMEEAREIERRRALGGEPRLPDVHLAPVAERIAILRAALDELEDELGVAQATEASPGR